MLDVSNRLPRLLPLAIILGSVLGAVDSRIAHAATFQVSDCTDGAGSGTLRNTVAAAPAGSTIEIPLMCSVISLTQGAIAITNSDLTVAGQGHSLTTIDGGSVNPDQPLYQRIFYSAASGTLSLHGMTITHATLPGDEPLPRGGCVYSRYDVALQDVLVTACTIAPAGNSYTSRGAGVYSAHNVTVANSTVSRNYAFASAGQTSAGGGIFARGSVNVSLSTISANLASSSPEHSPPPSRGGGIMAYAYGNGSVTIVGSTISGNSADVNAGMQAGIDSPTAARSGTLTILSSTIAGNVSLRYQAAGSYLSTVVTNSTLAFNSSGYSYAGQPAGLYSQQPIVMNNTIFANNVAQAGTSEDVSSGAPVNALSGAKNLITHTQNTVPPDTLNVCPKLGRLSDNGGATQTIPLLSGSAAINAGAANGQTTDQRGAGFPRTVGPGTDIGAYERQANLVEDEIFFSGFEIGCG